MGPTEIEAASWRGKNFLRGVISESFPFYSLHEIPHPLFRNVMLQLHYVFIFIILFI